MAASAAAEGVTANGGAGKGATVGHGGGSGGSGDSGGVLGAGGDRVEGDADVGDVDGVGCVTGGGGGGDAAAGGSGRMGANGDATGGAATNGAAAHARRGTAGGGATADDDGGVRAFARADGTRTYFFTQAELAALFVSAGFAVEELRTARVEHVNRKEGLTMRRCWVHAVFRKPVGGGGGPPA